MDLHRVPPRTTRVLAVVGAAFVAVGGALPHHLCVDHLVCAVPLVSLSPLAGALLVAWRGWSEYNAVGYGVLVGAFWGAGLFLVLTNAESVATDALVGTSFDTTMHRIGAALYLYGATLGLAAFTMREARRIVPGARLATSIFGAVLTAIPLLGLLPLALSVPDALLAEALPELVAVFAASSTGAGVLAVVYEPGLGG